MPLLNASHALIAPKTATETVIFTLAGKDLPARLSASGLAGAETVSLRAVDGPAETKTAVYRDGVAVTLKATDPIAVIDAPGPYEITKTVTAGLAGVFLAKG